MNTQEFTIDCAYNAIDILKITGNIDHYLKDERRVLMLLKGRLYFCFHHSGKFMRFETEIIDYLSQLLEAVEMFDSGEIRFDTVSSDWYSDGLELTLVDNGDRLNVYEKNTGVDYGNIDYLQFKSNLFALIKSIGDDLFALCPALRNYDILVKMFAKCR